MSENTDFSENVNDSDDLDELGFRACVIASISLALATAIIAEGGLL